MPIPSLPLDIVVEIVSHLEEEDKIANQTQEGKTISLVCRSWRWIGQDLRWKTVRIGTSTLPSLSDHFARFPHLTKLVRLFIFADPLLLVPDRQSSPELPHFLSTLVNLHELSIRGFFEENLVPTLRAASTLGNLRTMQIREYGEFEYVNEFSTSLQNGFKELDSLAFTALGYQSYSTARHEDLGESVSSKLSISRAVIEWSSEPFDSPKLASDFLSILDPATLSVVSLKDEAICTTSIRWLSHCQNLVELNLALHWFEDFSTVLPFLPHFASLKEFNLELTKEKEEAQSPVPLCDILTSLPPSLRFFVADQLIFSDFSHIPIRHLWTSRDIESITYVSGRCLSDDEFEGETTMLSLWAEEEDAKLKWFRMP
ncbi:hypothetical protein JCM3765_004868 [Sporobolomyces pararoseus]